MCGGHWIFGKSLRLVSKGWRSSDLHSEFLSFRDPLRLLFSPVGSFLAVTTSNNVFAWYKSEIRFNNLRVLYEVDFQPAQVFSVLFFNSPLSEGWG